MKEIWSLDEHRQSHKDRSLSKPFGTRSGIKRDQRVQKELEIFLRCFDKKHDVTCLSLKQFCEKFQIFRAPAAKRP